jgi:hypothetical protein
VSALSEVWDGNLSVDSPSGLFCLSLTITQVC